MKSIPHFFACLTLFLVGCGDSQSTSTDQNSEVQQQNKPDADTASFTIDITLNRVEVNELPDGMKFSGTPVDMYHWTDV